MLAFEDNWNELFKEFEKRKKQYSFVEVKGAIYHDQDGWKNIVTKFYPRIDSQQNANRTYNYGDVILFCRNLTVEETEKVFHQLEKQGKISLPQLEDYEAPKDLGRTFLSRVTNIFYSYHESEGLIFEWPSLLYTTNKLETLSIQEGRSKMLISPNLPFYPCLDWAVEKEIGFQKAFLNEPLWFGKVIIIVPEYRARMTLTLLSKNKIKVEVEIKQENLENLLCKYYCISEKGESYQGDITFKKFEEKIEFKDKISSFFFYLITKKGEIIDYKVGNVSSLPNQQGIKVELSNEFITSIIEEGENETMEFKERIGNKREEFIESIIAFSNSKGGTILLGVNDNCKIIGVQPEDIKQYFKNDLNKKSVQDWLDDIIRAHCEPTPKVSVDILEVEGKKIVWIGVAEGQDKPYLLKDKGPLIRVGSSDRSMTREELDQIYNKKKGFSNMF
jgi:hypothetical protein